MTAIPAAERAQLIAIEEKALRAGVGGHFRLRLLKTLAPNRASARSRVRYDVLAIREDRVVVRPVGGRRFSILRGQRDRARAGAA